MNDRLSIFLICLMLTAISGSMNAQQNQTQDLPLPAIPATLRTPHERASYLLAHFWDSMSFADTLSKTSSTTSPSSPMHLPKPAPKPCTC